MLTEDTAQNAVSIEKFMVPTDFVSIHDRERIKTAKNL